ncbi:MAG: hypothetical protein P8Y68_18715 [Anaerolineales bacterium]
MSDQQNGNKSKETRSMSMRGRGPMGHGRMAMLQGEKAHDFKGTMGKLIKYLGGYSKSILTVMIVAVASTVFTIVGPKLLGKATTKLFEGVMGQISGRSTDYLCSISTAPAREKCSPGSPMTLTPSARP